MVNEERWRAAGRGRTDEDRPSDRHYGHGGAVREPRGSGREGFWGRGHEDSGYERDAHREYSREDYGRGGYGESERGGDVSRGNEEDRGSRDAQRRRDQDFRGRGPKGYKRSDQRIQEDVNDRLADDPYVDASDIEVSVSGGEVNLTGTVEGHQSRRRAEDLAEQVSGVSYVQNGIRVAGRSMPQGSGATTPADFAVGSEGDIGR
jgi:BON domain